MWRANWQPRATYAGAVSKLRQAAAQNPDRAVPVPGTQWLNTLCWFGALNDRARDVLQYCDRAVNLQPDDVNIHDSRGLARALVGDTAGAVEDFWLVVERWTQSPPSNSDWLTRHREQWLVNLQAGTDPFDAATLEMLRSQ